MINCPHKDKEGCTNNDGKGFNNPQALKMHIFHKHKNLNVADKLESKGIETTREKPKETEKEIAKNIIDNALMMAKEKEKKKEKEKEKTKEPENEDDDGLMFG